MRQSADSDVLNHRITPSRFSSRPLYLQARDAMAERIAAGEYKPMTAIPNEGDLAREFGVSPGTMRKALDLLEAERLLTRRQGRGTFVNDQSSAELAVRYSALRGPDGGHISEEVDLLSLAEQPVSQAEAHRLRLRGHEKVHRIRRLRRSEGKPFMLEDVAMPAVLFPGLSAEKAPSHRIVVLAQQFGVLLGKGEERITIAAAAPEIASLLKVAPNAPLLVLDRLVRTLDGRPAEWRLAHCNLGDRHYRAEFR
jgi:GntR family transcriptional regulator